MVKMSQEPKVGGSKGSAEAEHSVWQFQCLPSSTPRSSRSWGVEKLLNVISALAVTKGSFTVSK